MASKKAKKETAYFESRPRTGVPCTLRNIGGRPARAAWWRASLLALCFGLSGLWDLSAHAAEKRVSEFAVKAAYLSKFGGFIRWPDTTFSSDASPLTICVTGEGPVGAALHQVAGHTVGGRAIAVRVIEAFSTDAGCHILYAGDSDAERVSQIFGSARGAGVLTVTDLGGDLATPAVITFVMKENNVRFEINEQAAFDNGLSISSQLLGLAVSVKTRG